MKRVAMQYSPMCAIPYVSMVDAGTVELVRSVGVEVVSSAELIQTSSRVDAGSARNRTWRPGRRVDKVRAKAFALIRERTSNGAPRNRTRSEDSSCATLRKSGAVHRPRTDCREPTPTLRIRTTNRPRSNTRRSARATLCCWICGPSSISRARSTMTSPGPVTAATIRRTRIRNVFAVVTGARDAAIRTREGRHRGGRSAARLRSGRCLPRHIEASGFGDTSPIAQATRSARRYTATAPTWTTWRPTTSAA